MKFILVAAASILSFAVASPTQPQPGNERNMFARDLPKLNQYRTLDDCKNDRDILYHAAPSLGNCYDLDGQTGAFFYNTAGFLHASANKDVGCNGESLHIKGGECMEKGDYKSVVFQ